MGAVHDVSDGGLLTAVAEMALAGGIGVQLYPYEGRLPQHAAWFGRTRAVTCWPPIPALAEEIIERSRLLALPARVIGRVGGRGLQPGMRLLWPWQSCGRRMGPGCRASWAQPKPLTFGGWRPRDGCGVAGRRRLS